MIWIKKNWLLVLLLAVALIALNKQCEKPKTIIKTVTKIERITDTVVKTIISKPQTVYVERTKNIKGKDTIIYKDSPTDSTVTANQYQATLQANEATAELKITTTGELLDVQGAIDFPKVTETNTITKTKPMSGLFLYGTIPTNVNNFRPEVGLMYQFKNKALIMGGVQYNQFTNKVDFKVGIGIKVF